METPQRRASSGQFRQALVLGLAIAIALFVFSELAVYFGFGRWARIIEWQASLFQSLVPAHNIGTVDHPVYEGTPVHLVAWYVGVILSAPLYIALVYAALLLKRDRAL